MKHINVKFQTQTDYICTKVDGICQHNGDTEREDGNDFCIGCGYMWNDLDNRWMAV